MKSVLDSPFEYTPSFQTDVRKTFERIRREQQAKIRQEQQTQVSPLAGAALLPNSPAERCERRFSTQISDENDERRQRINLNLNLREVVVEVKHGGHGNQTDISADSKDCGLAP